MSGHELAPPDITLFLDGAGVIRDVNLGKFLSDEKVSSWLGRPWVETVDDPGGAGIRRMLADARVHGVSDFRQIAQRFPSGLEVPVEYNTVRLGGKAGLIAVGKNVQGVAELQARLVAAQHAREQDYWKLREVETRYRLLFDSSNEPVLLVRADDLRVLEANPAAMRSRDLAVGWDFEAAVTPADRDSFHAMLGRVRAEGRAPGILVHLGADRSTWSVRASLASAEPGAVFLLQLSSVASTQNVTPLPTPAAVADRLIERLPDGFVLLDQEGVVRRANHAFLDLIQASAAPHVLGQPIGRWLHYPGADAAVLLANVERHGLVRNFATTISGELGLEAAVEISAIGEIAGRPRQVCLLLRDVSRRPTPMTQADGISADLGALGSRIGTVPLLQLVRETVAVIERHYMEHALERAAGNRTAAAELLGLSRQSLYAKLSRYNLDGGVPATATGD